MRPDGNRHVFARRPVQWSETAEIYTFTAIKSKLSNLKSLSFLKQGWKCLLTLWKTHLKVSIVPIEVTAWTFIALAIVVTNVLPRRSFEIWIDWNVRCQWSFTHTELSITSWSKLQFFHYKTIAWRKFDMKCSECWTFRMFAFFHWSFNEVWRTLSAFLHTTTVHVFTVTN